MFYVKGNTMKKENSSRIKPIRPTIIGDKRIIKAVLKEVNTAPSAETIAYNKRYKTLLEIVRKA